MTRIFGFFNDFIPYYRQLRPMMKSLTTCLLAPRLQHWFELKPKGFYKFLEPAPDHEKYKVGDSWTEELCFSAFEFNNAFENLGVTYKSRTEYKKAENKFVKIVEDPIYEKVKHGKGNGVNIKKKGSTKQEREMYYCRYYDRRSGLTWYFMNPNKSLTDEILNMLKIQKQNGIDSAVEPTSVPEHPGNETGSVTDQNPFRLPDGSDFGSYNVTLEDNTRSQSLEDDLAIEDHKEEKPLVETDVSTSRVENGEAKKPIFDDKDKRCAEWMFSLILGLNPNFKRPNFEKWANEIRLMRERDNRTYEQIAALFTWANNDEFWRNNILSPSKFREKFDVLLVRMKNDKPKDRVMAVYESAMRGAEMAIEMRKNGGSRW